MMRAAVFMLNLAGALAFYAIAFGAIVLLSH
jgi:hypothetical protein